MRFLKLVSCVCLFSFVAVACNDEKGTDGPKPSSNGIVNGESQSSAFTLTFYSTFNGLNFSERTYGRFGAFFAEKGSFDQDAVDAWANGGTVQNREFMKETSQLLAGDRMKLFLEGLEPETEYELCAFFEAESGRRMVGKTQTVSTKAFTGHATSASGSIEAVICLIAMQSRFIPANYGWSNSTPDCINPVSRTMQKELHHILCNSFGFGGNDSSLIISDKEISLDGVPQKDYMLAGENEITQEEELKELREYISPMESRRMCKVMKAAFLTSLRAIQKAGITKPDAIIVATQYGMLENGEKILNTIHEQGEESISPTLFMQSTHNTLAGALAIHLGCHGYNITYSQGAESLQWALRDAQRLIREGKASSVLVGLHNHVPSTFKAVLDQQGITEPYEIYSKSIIIKSAL